jgi:hypothetical protein
VRLANELQGFKLDIFAFKIYSWNSFVGMKIHVRKNKNMKKKTAKIKGFLDKFISKQRIISLVHSFIQFSNIPTFFGLSTTEET